MDYLQTDHAAARVHAHEVSNGGDDTAARAPTAMRAHPADPATATQWEHLRFRVIALENLLIALMADEPRERLDRARNMAPGLTPQGGFTEHPATLLAAAHIVRLVERARHLKTRPTHRDHSRPNLGA